MQFLVYILVYPFLWMISKLPFKLLYAFSDGLYILIYRIFGYRKKTVNDNLRLVFPEKTNEEIKAIAKKFYHHMCDMFLEMIKSLSITQEQLNKRFIIRNVEELKQIDEQSQSYILMFGHYSSYEWTISVQDQIKAKGFVIYKSLKNTYFDRLVRSIRSKYNSELVDTKKAIEKINEYHSLGKKSCIAFLSDQSPKLKANNHWADFMGIKVPCFVGAEVTAKKYNYPVGYLKIEKVKRGHYEADFVLLAEDPSKFKDFEITDKFNRVLESQIRKAPEYYLWTHKRWKHRNQAPI